MYVIIDIDGTLADNSHREGHINKNPKDWETFLKPELVAQDSVLPGAQRGIENLRNQKHELIFLTGRNEGLRLVTADWLQQHFGLVVNEEWLLMRPIGNMLKPTEYKREQIQRLVTTIDRSHGLVFVDDDPFMWPIYREYGLCLKAPDCWQVLFPEAQNLPEETHWRK
jgi:hydroxymethylpyrimidine pyrophosphatase-like HAD family hydrolase